MIKYNLRQRTQIKLINPEKRMEFDTRNDPLFPNGNNQKMSQVDTRKTVYPRDVVFNGH